jgi:uncharacterized protein with von Willebrand factor type A (vWA) domain
VLTVGGPLFEAQPALLGELLGRLDALDDARFLRVLPAVRQGFEVLSTAGRQRLLETLVERWGSPHAAGHGRLAGELELEESAEDLADFARAEQAGQKALAALGLLPAADENAAPSPSVAPGSGGVGLLGPEAPGRHLRRLDRWRLMLGQERRRLTGLAGRAARALDELYGSGHGEGSRGELDDGQGGGDQTSFPSTREWSDELGELFGSQVRQEVLGRAVELGRPEAALELDPEAVTPSVELLEQVLSLKGGMAESQLERLRRLVDRVVRALVEELKVRLAPALSGLTTPRPTLRRRGPLDLPRTLRRNLHTARFSDDGEGTVELRPERFVFRTRAQRSMDWHLVLVVDVSGSMEASVIHSAMMAAILSGLPALTVHFVAFSTEVMDLSARVDDPLGLLLEISVGGGTFIGKAMRYARELLKVPSRSLVVLVSDFEDGGPVGLLLQEVRTLVEAGAHPLGLAALSDSGQPRYHQAIAERCVEAGMPVAALTPLELARWVGEKLRGGGPR